MVDSTIAAAVLLITAPIMLGAGLLVRLTMGSPVLFRQARAGQGARVFDMVKFRTMRNPRPGEEGPEHDAARLTRLGNLLRATSIDELPALINVVRGQMRLVGPRPLPVRYLSRYSEHHARRHEVPPGITGYAQVSGRNNLSWDEQLDLDVWYVDHRSFGLDMKIMLKTVTAVLKRQGISQDGHATRPEFPGSGVVAGSVAGAQPAYAAVAGSGATTVTERAGGSE